MTLSINRTPIPNVTTLHPRGLLPGFLDRILFPGRIVSGRLPWKCQIQGSEHDEMLILMAGGRQHRLGLGSPQSPPLVTRGCTGSITTSQQFLLLLVSCKDEARMLALAEVLRPLGDFIHGEASVRTCLRHSGIHVRRQSQK